MAGRLPSSGNLTAADIVRPTRSLGAAWYNDARMTSGVKASR